MTVRRVVPRIAIACSGLGWTRRGNETWARGIAEELHAAGVSVTLLGGGEVDDARCPYVRLPGLPRETPVWRRMLSWHRRYLLEQVAFGAALQRYLRREPHDIVHVADPILALRLQRRAGALGVKVVYKDGLLLGPSWLRNFPFAQVLAPWYLEQAELEGHDTSRWFAIPHLVDVEAFRPASDRQAVRATLPLELPPGAFVVLGVGDLSPGSNKRLDWLVRETARLPDGLEAHLVLVGQASPEDRQRFERVADAALPGRVHVVTNVPAEGMARWYQAADVFAHAALREPFGIVFLEAMASGLPIIGHRFAVTEWIVGAAGTTVDMTTPGELSRVLEAWAGDDLRRAALGEAARREAESRFRPDRIVPLYRRMYDRVLGH